MTTSLERDRPDWLYQTTTGRNLSCGRFVFRGLNVGAIEFWRSNRGTVVAHAQIQMT
jgi:hypothetical protein